MKTSKQRYSVKRFLAYLVLLAVCGLSMLLIKSPYVYAENEKETVLSPHAYESLSQDIFVLDEENRVNTFSYGKQELGQFSLRGKIEEETVFSDRAAYVADGPLEVHYLYEGELRSENPDEWNIYAAETDQVGNIALKNKVSEGALIIQKSVDGKEWGTVSESNDFLLKEKDNLLVLRIEDEDRIAGSFYRVILAYGVRRRIEENAEFEVPAVGLEIDFPFVDSDKYENDCCTQVYEFYVCSHECPVILRDVISGENITSSEKTDKGFQIDKRASQARVDVSHNGDPLEDIQSYESFYLPGNYKIDIKTPLGASYHYEMLVEEGLAFETLTPTVFENRKKNGYSEANQVSGKAVSGIGAYSTLKLGYAGDATCKKGSYFQTPAYGITGNGVCLFLSLTQKQKMKENGWIICPDSWGKSKSDKIYEVSTGQIDSGAVIVQTSFDGNNWVNQENLGYATGLYNTDFENNYGDNRDVLLYVPSGADVLNGLYVRVVYAYMTRGTETEEEYRYLENYTFFLCSNELGAVTIHNLSLENSLAEVLEDQNDTQAEAHMSSEDMLSGSGTVTGFTIDKQLNPVAYYSISKDGVEINTIGGEKFTETGRYDISLKNFLGTEEIRSFYVDRMSAEDAYKLYFGDSLLVGKRLFSEGEYPAYEGGLTSVHLNAISDSYLPISGTITNMSTGSVINMVASREEREETLFEAGSYEAVFTNNPFAGEDKQSGDYRTFIFHFDLIESGKAPGPVINKNSLNAFNRQNISGCTPHAYALIYQSASKGNIALIFSTKQRAHDFAVKYESGTVEKQSDGTYRYTGSFLVNKKTEYNSNWDVSDAIEYFSDLAVQDWYFDLSDEYTYLSLDEQVLQDYENLKTLELEKSVAVFASEEDRAELGDIEALPLLNSLKYAHLTPGNGGIVERGKNHFEFVKDEHGWDSSMVTIIDSKGNEYEIQHNRDVEEQLKAAGCVSGIVTVKEETVYGDTSEYRAVYLAENKNLETVTLSFITDGKSDERVLRQSNDGYELSTDAFEITSIEDETDPYSIIKVKKDDLEVSYYTPEELYDHKWATSGDYQIKFINRLGYYFTIKVHIKGDTETEVSFSGPGTEKLKAFSVSFGDQKIQLPEIERYGYDFEGYRDNYGNTYNEEIEEVLYKGSLVLEPIWNPKSVKVILEKPDGSIYQTDEVPFGTDYRIGAYISDNKNEHVNGWLYNGQLYTNNIHIEKEDDYVLRVSTDEILVDEKRTSDHAESYATESVTRNISTESEREKTTGEAEGVSAENNGSGIKVILVIVILAALVPAALITFKKRSGK